MGEKNSIHTVISYNRGASWDSIKRPEGTPCTDESKVDPATPQHSLQIRFLNPSWTHCFRKFVFSRVKLLGFFFQSCYLQIHNTYSVAKNVRAERPYSIENAPGIILVHGTYSVWCFLFMSLYSNQIKVHQAPFLPICSCEYGVLSVASQDTLRTRYKWHPLMFLWPVMEVTLGSR